MMISDLFKNLFSNKDKPKMENLIKAGAFLVDVRSKEEFAENHVTSSINIPLDQIQKQLHQFKNKEQIIVFCRSGMRSGQAKGILERNGFANVTNGGSWQSINNFFNKQ